MTIIVFSGPLAVSVGPNCLEPSIRNDSKLSTVRLIAPIAVTAVSLSSANLCDLLGMRVVTRSSDGSSTVKAVPRWILSNSSSPHFLPGPGSLSECPRLSQPPPGALWDASAPRRFNRLGTVITYDAHRILDWHILTQNGSHIIHIACNSCTSHMRASYLSLEGVRELT